MFHALITGGCGFIGAHLSKKLLNSGCKVTLVDNFQRGVRDQFINNLTTNKNITLLDLDLLDQKSLDALPTDVEMIFHCAAIVGVQNVISAPYCVLTHNHMLFENIIKYAKSLLTLCCAMFFSTSEVYAATLGKVDITFPTPENQTLVVPDPASPRSTYALSKIYGESLCYASGLPFLVVRPHNIYGPRMGDLHVIPQLTKKILESTKTKNHVDVFSPSHKRTFCYVSDAVEYLYLIIQEKSAYGQIYNLGVESPECSIMQLASMISKIVNPSVELIEGAITMGSPERRVPCTKLLRQATKYQPVISLNDGLDRTVKWYLQAWGS